MQIDGNDEVVNKSLGNFLRCLTTYRPRKLDNVLAQVDFSYNKLVNRSIWISAFQIVQGRSLHGVDILGKLPTGMQNNTDDKSFYEHMKEVHQKVRIQLEKSNSSYKLKFHQKR